MVIHGGPLPQERTHPPWPSTCQANLSGKYRVYQYWLDQYVALA
jgi:hypothetical protein